MNPLDVISKGAKLNPGATKILIAVPVLLACVALAGTLVSDVKTAIIGAVLTIIGSVILLIVTSIAKDVLGGMGTYLARFCLFSFCAITLTLFGSWIADFPKPLGCLLKPLEICRTDFVSGGRGSELQPTDDLALLQGYLFPKNMSGTLDQAKFEKVDTILRSLGRPGGRRDLAALLVDGSPDAKAARKQLVKELGLPQR